MLAAIQYNMRGGYNTYSIIRLKVVEDEFFFYSMKADPEYMKELFRELPNRIVTVLKQRGLHLSIPEQRKKIIEYLWLIREVELQRK